MFLAVLRKYVFVKLEARRDVTDFYPISLASQVDVSEWKIPIDSEQPDSAISGFLTVLTDYSRTPFVHCEFHENRRVFVQVVCRHFNYRMGILQPVK